MRGQLLRYIVALSIAVVALNPASLLACSVCYGDPDSAMSKGLGWGILTLLAVVLIVLTGISTFFVHIARRASKNKD